MPLRIDRLSEIGTILRIRAITRALLILKITGTPSTAEVCVVEIVAHGRLPVIASVAHHVALESVVIHATILEREYAGHVDPLIGHAGHG